MAALTFFLNDVVTPTLATVDPGAESTTNTGWTVAKVAPTAYAYMVVNTKRASSAFGAAVEPETSGGVRAFDGYWSSPLTGTFDAGIYVATMKVIAVGSGGDQDGNLRFLLYRAADIVNGPFTQLFATAVDGGAVTNLATATAQASSGSSASIGPFTFANESLGIYLGWKITGAGGATTRDVLLRKGTPCTLVTPNFTAAGGAAKSLVYADRRVARNTLLRRMQVLIPELPAGYRRRGSGLLAPA